MTTNSSKQAAIKVAHTTQEGATDGDENESTAQGRTYIPHKCGMCGLAGQCEKNCLIQV